MDELQPGQVVGPQTTPPAPITESPAPVLGPAPAPVAIEPPRPEIEPRQPPAPQTPWQFNQTSVPDNPDSLPAAQAPVTWTASEFIAHQKSARWYGILGLGAVVGGALVYLLTRDKISTAVVLVAALAFGVFAARKPRVLEYRLDGGGLVVGSKVYNYELFKSFSVMHEGAISSIIFMPLKRFMPSLTIYYAPEDEPKILQVLSERLPVEDKHGDMVDKLMRRIRF